MKRYIVLGLLLAFLLTGCGNSDYKKAMTLYEEGNYEEAMVLFTELTDYEDSAQKVLDCRYMMAVDAYENREYASAIVIFTELRDYKDCEERILDCQYMMAVEAYKKEDYASALNYFTALKDYKDADEYRMESAWKALHAYIQENGEKLDSATKLSYVHKNESGQIIQTDLATVASNPEQLIFYNGNKVEVMGIMHFSDLAITITRGDPEAAFQISSNLTGLGTVSKKSGDGVLNISSATENTQLNPNNYLYYYTDIFGKSHSETEMDPTDRAAVQERYMYVLEGVSAILGQTGLGISLADLGFSAMR